MQIIMGGSGSTGSSLLKNILGRHSDIFASQETSLFAKKSLIEDWNRNKKRIFRTRWFGLKNHGFHRYTNVDFYFDEIGLTKKEINQLLPSSNSLSAFSDELFTNALLDKKAEHWLEKTPANSCLFQELLSIFPQGQVIQTVRHPLDTIASLVRRGFDPYYATCVYLVNTATGLMARDHDHYMEVRYEELVQDPSKELARVCKILALPFQQSMLIPHQEKHISVTKLIGWKYDETATVGNESINRFQQLDINLQAEIITAINHIYINENGCARYNTNITSISEIAQVLNYNLETDIKSLDPGILKKYKRRDQWNRFRYGFSKAVIDYPIEIG